MKLNSFIKIRATSEMKKELKEISQALGFKEMDLARYLLNRGIQQLKLDSINAGGYDKLEFTLRHK